MRKRSTLLLRRQPSPQDHYTLCILTPRLLPDDVGPGACVGRNGLILTDKRVSEEYRVDYQRCPEDRLLQIIHLDSYRIRRRVGIV